MRSTPVGFRCPDCAPTKSFALADDLIVTKAIIAINVLVFLVGLGLQVSNGAAPGIWGGGADNPLLSGGQLVTFQVHDGDWWRILTSGFLHAGLLHIGMNMYFIYSFGGLLEPALGRVRFGLLYTVGIVGGSLGAMLLSPVNVPTVGASGAAFALLGAAFVMARLRGHTELESNLLTLAALNFAITFMLPGISKGGHLGGFVVGLIAGAVAYGPLARKKQAIAAVYAVFAVALFAAAMYVADAKTAAALRDLMQSGLG
jgi:membrane associated rhomboid family serine protease